MRPTFLEFRNLSTDSPRTSSKQAIVGTIMTQQRVALTGLITDSAGFIPTPISWIKEKRKHNVCPYEQLKVPRLSAPNHPPGEEYDQFSASRIYRKEVVAYRHVSAEGSSVHPDVNSRDERPLDTSGSDSPNTQLGSAPDVNQDLTGQIGVLTPRSSIVSDLSSNLPLESPDPHSSMESVYQGKASVARLDNLPNILPHYLLECMETSLIRRLEEMGGIMPPLRLTSAVGLYLGAKIDRDFKLEISVGSTSGKVISQSLAELGSVEDLRSLLGERLFDGMKSSNHRKEEEERGILACTGTVRVFPLSGVDSNSDCMLEVMLDYNTGLGIWHDVF